MHLSGNHRTEFFGYVVVQGWECRVMQTKGREARFDYPFKSELYVVIDLAFQQTLDVVFNVLIERRIVDIDFHGVLIWSSRHQNRLLRPAVDQGPNRAE